MCTSPMFAGDTTEHYMKNFVRAIEIIYKTIYLIYMYMSFLTYFKAI